MRIIFETIPNDQQRYPTVGDWWVDGAGDWHVRVSKMSDWRYEFLVFIHEITEMAWCIFHGVREEDVTAFDKQFEEKRAKGLVSEYAEPGDAKDAPYRKGHRYATWVEWFTAYILGVKWAHYENEINNL